jgi:hypothetical protein
MLKRPPPETPADRRRRAAERQRERRRRDARGLRVFHIEANEHDLAEAMIANGRLTPEQALRRSLVEGELAKLVTDWIARWIKPRHA